MSKKYGFQNLLLTRLEILSRPKAPKILQELLSNSKELPNSRPTKLLKNFKRFRKIQKVPKDSKKIPKRFQNIPKDSKDYKKLDGKASKCLEMLKKLISPSLLPLPPPSPSLHRLKIQRIRGAPAELAGAPKNRKNEYRPERSTT